jgi:hypothetical protein
MFINETQLRDMVSRILRDSGVMPGRLPGGGETRDPPEREPFEGPGDELEIEYLEEAEGLGEFEYPEVEIPPLEDPGFTLDLDTLEELAPAEDPLETETPEEECALEEYAVLEEVETVKDDNLKAPFNFVMGDPDLGAEELEELEELEAPPEPAALSPQPALGDEEPGSSSNEIARRIEFSQGPEPEAAGNEPLEELEIVSPFSSMLSGLDDSENAGEDGSGKTRENAASSALERLGPGPGSLVYTPFAAEAPPDLPPPLKPKDDIIEIRNGVNYVSEKVLHPGTGTEASLNPGFKNLINSVLSKPAE